MNSHDLLLQVVDRDYQSMLKTSNLHSLFPSSISRSLALLSHEYNSSARDQGYEAQEYNALSAYSVSLLTIFTIHKIILRASIHKSFKSQLTSLSRVKLKPLLFKFPDS